MLRTRVIDTMSRIVFKEIDEIINIVEVVDSCDSILLGVVDGGSEEESSNSTKTIDTKIH
jgi:hypothetical protein